MTKKVVLELTRYQAEQCRQALNFAADLRGSVPPHDPYFDRRATKVLDGAAKQILKQLNG